MHSLTKKGVISSKLVRKFRNKCSIQAKNVKNEGFETRNINIQKYEIL